MQIDWQDFVVVSTVEITETDAHIDLPVPMSLRELENMTIAQKRLAAMISEEEWVEEDEVVENPRLVDFPGASEGRAQADGAEGGQGEEMQMDDSEDEEAPQAAPTSAPTVELKRAMSSTKPPANIKIRKDYVPKTLAERQRQAAQQAMTTCPVCGESIPTAEMDEHVRIELLNPKYRQQRADLEARMTQQAALTEGADPSKFLRSFAGARRDIFGLQEQETSLAQREEEERRRAKEREKIVWDGHAASRTRTTGDFNRTEQLEATTRDLQDKFKPKDTESIGPQVRPQDVLATPAQPPPSVEQYVVGSDGSSGPVSYAGAGMKRPATGEAVEGGQQPPLQRVAYEVPNGSASPASPGGPSVMPGPLAPSAPTGPRQPYGYPMAPGQPAPYGAMSPQTVPGTASLVLCLPDGNKTVSYDNLPVATTTVASIRDRVQATEFPTIGASRIKLKLVRTGRVLNLKQTLAEIGVMPSLGAETVEPDVVEVTIK